MSPPPPNAGMTAAGPRWSRRSASAGDAVVRPRLPGRPAELSLSLRLAPHPQLRRVPHGPDAGRAGGAPGHGPGPRAVVRGRVLPDLHRAGRHGVRARRAAPPVSGMDRADRRRRRHPVRAISARRAAPGSAHARAQGPARRLAAGAHAGVSEEPAVGTQCEPCRCVPTLEGWARWGTVLKDTASVL